jgi:Tfp pilus assembly protein PilW
MKVSNVRDVKSANRVNLLVQRNNMAFQGIAAGEVVIYAATTENGEWAEVGRFRGTMAAGVAWAKAATIIVTGARKAHVGVSS